jgi:hypothetical protein
MKYAVEMGSDATIYIPSIIKIGSNIQKLIRGIHRNTKNMQIAYAYFHFLKQGKQAKIKNESDIIHVFVFYRRIRCCAFPKGVSEPFILTRVNPSTVCVHILNTLRYDTVIGTATDQYMSLYCDVLL